CSRALSEAATLADSDIVDGTTIELRVRLRGGAPKGRQHGAKKVLDCLADAQRLAASALEDCNELARRMEARKAAPAAADAAPGSLSASPDVPCALDQETGLDDASCQPGQSVEHRASDIQPLAVLEAEQALLSFWLMRGGGESGDKAVRPWFRQEDGAHQSLDAERLAGVLSDRLGVADTDLACASALLARIVGNGRDAARELSEEALQKWLRCRFPAFQLQQMLESVDFVTAIVPHLLGTMPHQDGLDRFRSLTKADVAGALRASLDESVEAVWAKITAFQSAVSRDQGGGGGNLKFAGDLGSGGSSFEGKFETADAFDAGLEKFIGLPDPKVLDAILIEHCHSANSDTPFTTSNYNLTCTPREEFECALNPDPLKTYPGAGPGHNQREILPFRVLLAATGCLDKEKWEDSELKPVLLKIQDMCDLNLTEQDKVHALLAPVVSLSLSSSFSPLLWPPSASLLCLSASSSN
ncbi:MAG: hypothetical protein ACPIOQ_02620, partial [Promethearchaeia archaeon]